MLYAYCYGYNNIIDIDFYQKYYNMYSLKETYIYCYIYNCKYLFKRVVLLYNWIEWMHSMSGFYKVIYFYLN